MATLDEIGQERQRISERLAQLDAERTKLSDQLNDQTLNRRPAQPHRVGDQPGGSERAARSASCLQW